MDTTRVDELASSLGEAAARATDGCRPIQEDDAQAIARELLTADRMPTWLQATGPSYVWELARHQRREWVADAVESGPWGTGGWVCECGTVITDGADLSVPGGLAGISAGNVWAARHQVAVLTAAGLL